MTSVVCTLFEGDYHYGVGALANSLYAQGFRGTICVGYRGGLPPWAAGAKPLKRFTDFSPASGLTLRFIPLMTEIHFSNYKPHFMLEVWATHFPAATSLFYFDPDITVRCRWSFFQEWVEAGVALCADVNSWMPASHPTRYAWKKFCALQGMATHRESNVYCNGGYVGVSVNNQCFLTLWKTLIERIGEAVGTLNKIRVADRTEKFCMIDQDALNIALMATQRPISLMGQEAMDFKAGGWVMSHAAGVTKPWRKAYLRSAIFQGVPPSCADKQYFMNLQHPIRLCSGTDFAWRALGLKLASALGRFYRRT